MGTEIIVLILVLVAVALVVGIVLFCRIRRDDWQQKAAGKLGEQVATGAIRSVLSEQDRLFTNVTVRYRGEKAELDNVIVNHNGVFIVEVKNYSGRLRGAEQDYSWWKYHVSAGGRTYVKEVKNPIRQVRRQTYLLAHFLQEAGIRAWVDGYAFLLDGNSPVRSRFVLQNVVQIDRTVHREGRMALPEETVEKIARLLQNA